MFDGGGAGRAGSQFEGGGLLSTIANMFGRPVGAADETRPQARPQGLLGIQPSAPMSAPQPQPAQPMQYSGRGYVGMPQFNLPVMTPRPAPPPGVPFGGYDVEYNPQMEYSGRGSGGMPMPQWTGMTPNPQQAQDLVAYLRSIGVQGY